MFPLTRRVQERVIGPRQANCVPPHLQGAGAGDQSVIPRPSSLFQARGRGVGARIGLLPMTCCLPLGGLGGGDLG